MLGTVATVKPR